jgi:hypothetical protein
LTSSITSAAVQYCTTRTHEFHLACTSAARTVEVEVNRGTPSSSHPLDLKPCYFETLAFVVIDRSIYSRHKRERDTSKNKLLKFGHRTAKQS